MKTQFKKFTVTLKESINYLPLILFYGPNQSEIKERCDEATQLICGPNGKEEMRVHKLNASLVLKDSQSFYDKLKTVGFFPGRQVLIIEGATDKLTNIIKDALDDWGQKDATIILIATSLKITSSLRKMVEQDPSSLSIVIYDEQQDEKKIEQVISSSQLRILDADIIKFLKNPSNFSSFNSLKSLIDKLEIYKMSDPKPVTFKEIELFFSESDNPDVFEMLDKLANGDIENMVLLLKGLFNKGINPNQIIILANKHFTLIHKLSQNLNSPDIVLNKNFPPIYGHHRQQVVKHAQIWPSNLIERALDIIQSIEKNLRSSSRVELTSILERAFLRIASLTKLTN